MITYKTIGIIFLSILFLNLGAKAQDSVSYQGKQYLLNKDGDKSFIVTSTDTVRFIIESYPQYPGGIQEMYKYLAKNLKYQKLQEKIKFKDGS